MKLLDTVALLRRHGEAQGPRPTIVRLILVRIAESAEGTENTE